MPENGDSFFGSRTTTVWKCLGCGRPFKTRRLAQRHRYQMRKDRNRLFYPKCAE